MPDSEGVFIVLNLEKKFCLLDLLINRIFTTNKLCKKVAHQ